jgi:hypothetical protein
LVLGFRNLGSETNILDQQHCKFFFCLYTSFTSQAFFSCLDDAQDVLAKLAAVKKTRQNDLKIGLLSNFDNRLHDIVPALGKN